MGFIDSYKKLEKLCGDVLRDDRKISAYIDEMINTPNGTFYVSGWEDDLKQLKHYRWIRNQIAHEPGCTETNMCVPADTLWLNNFYSRIMNQTDPLALHRKATSRKTNASRTTWETNSTRSTYNPPHSAPQQQPSGCAICMLALVIAVSAFALLLSAI